MLPLIVILLLVGVVTSAIGESDEAPSRGLFERLTGFAEAIRPKPRSLELSEPYSPTGKLLPIDLRDKVNKKLSDETIQQKRNTLESLPEGDGEFAGIRFDVVGVMQLTSKRREHFPKSIDGISVDSTFTQLYAFHATQGDTQLGQQIGKYVIHYLDGTQEEWPVVYGIDVRNWWTVDRAKSERGKIAWIGENHAASRHGCELRLYVSKWQNPHPETTVTHVDYISKNHKDVAPFCIGLTMEKAAPAEEESETTPASV